jgi:hypothetical protein
MPKRGWYPNHGPARFGGCIELEVTFKVFGHDVGESVVVHRAPHTAIAAAIAVPPPFLRASQ